MTESIDVELRLPADGAYASVLRTTTAALAARIDFTIDDIEDLRMAVAEATAMVLEVADDGTDLVSSFGLRPGEMTVAVSVGAQSPGEPDYDSFAWQVLTTLSTTAKVEAAGGRFTVTMTLTSTATAPTGPATPEAEA
jgi:serine/threonine-protein kinase RsbW